VDDRPRGQAKIVRKKIARPGACNASLRHFNDLHEDATTYDEGESGIRSPGRIRPERRRRTRESRIPSRRLASST